MDHARKIEAKKVKQMVKVLLRFHRALDDLIERKDLAEYVIKSEEEIGPGSRYHFASGACAFQDGAKNFGDELVEALKLKPVDWGTKAGATAAQKRGARADA